MCVEDSSAGKHSAVEQRNSTSATRNANAFDVTLSECSSQSPEAGNVLRIIFVSMNCGFESMPFLPASILSYCLPI